MLRFIELEGSEVQGVIQVAGESQLGNIQIMAGCEPPWANQLILKAALVELTFRCEWLFVD